MCTLPASVNKVLTTHAPHRAKVISTLTNKQTISILFCRVKKLHQTKLTRAPNWRSTRSTHPDAPSPRPCVPPAVPRPPELAHSGNSGTVRGARCSTSWGVRVTYLLLLLLISSCSSCSSCCSCSSCSSDHSAHLITSWRTSADSFTLRRLLN